MRKPTFILTISSIITILILSVLFGVANAQSVEELLKTPGLTSDQRAAIADAIAKQKATTSLPEQIKGMLEWKEMGEAFAITIEKICKTLNVEVNAFLRSDVGMLTAGVIIYKMVGKDILTIILCTAIWLGVTMCFGISIKVLHMNKLVTEEIKDEEGNITKKIVPVERFSWMEKNIKSLSLIFHLVLWFTFSCVLTATVMSI